MICLISCTSLFQYTVYEYTTYHPCTYILTQLPALTPNLDRILWRTPFCYTKNCHAESGSSVRHRSDLRTCCARFGSCLRKWFALLFAAKKLTGVIAMRRQPCWRRRRSCQRHTPLRSVPSCGMQVIRYPDIIELEQHDRRYP